MLPYRFFCDGFSTFLTFSNETLQLLMNNRWGEAVLNVRLSLILCLLAFFGAVMWKTRYLTIHLI